MGAGSGLAGGLPRAGMRKLRLALFRGAERFLECLYIYSCVERIR